jgi:hypothetical protein
MSESEELKKITEKLDAIIDILGDITDKLDDVESAVLKHDLT